MTSGADGGATVTNNEDYAREIRKISHQGFRTLSGKAGASVVPRDLRQDWAFERHDRLGYNFRMSAMQAALGLAQLERLDYLVAARQYIASRFQEVLRETKCRWLIPPVVPAGSPVISPTPANSMKARWAPIGGPSASVSWRRGETDFTPPGGRSTSSPSSRPWPFRLKGALPQFDPRYKGKVKSYQVGDCPVLEGMQRYLCQFKTSMQTLEKAEQQVEALRQTIVSFG